LPPDIVDDPLKLFIVQEFLWINGVSANVTPECFVVSDFNNYTRSTLLTFESADDLNLIINTFGFLAVFVSIANQPLVVVGDRYLDRLKGWISIEKTLY